MALDLVVEAAGERVDVAQDVEGDERGDEALEVDGRLALLPPALVGRLGLIAGTSGRGYYLAAFVAGGFRVVPAGTAPSEPGGRRGLSREGRGWGAEGVGAARAGAGARRDSGRGYGMTMTSSAGLADSSCCILHPPNSQRTTPAAPAVIADTVSRAGGGPRSRKSRNVS